MWKEGWGIWHRTKSATAISFSVGFTLSDIGRAERISMEVRLIGHEDALSPLPHYSLSQGSRGGREDHRTDGGNLLTSCSRSVGTLASLHRDHLTSAAIGMKERKREKGLRQLSCRATSRHGQSGPARPRDCLQLLKARGMCMSCWATTQSHRQ